MIARRIVSKELITTRRRRRIRIIRRRRVTTTVTFTTPLGGESAKAKIKSKKMSSEGKKLIYQLGTNNWQSEKEYAPGSGILHSSHHEVLESSPGFEEFVPVSLYPSQIYSSHPNPNVEVFKVEKLPVCESSSPVSSYRWHTMSEDDFNGYRTRLEDTVYKQMAEAEERLGGTFTLAIAHHTFLNPVVLRNVIQRRMKEGKPKTALACFVHGTALKMYVHEKEQKNPEEYPLRFLPFIEKEKVFSPADGGVEICYAISTQQIEKFRDIFPSFPADRVVISPNGINQNIFHKHEGLTIANTLSEFSTVPYEGSTRSAEKIDGSKFDQLVVTVSKFADWKRIPGLLYAAKIYEEKFPKCATIIVGTGPLDAQKEYQDLALEELGLKRCFFLGPQPQPVLAKLYTIASAGVFASKNEPFGMTLIENMACGTPSIGANSGGPKDFIDDSVGMLVEETDDIEVLGERISEAVSEALTDDWKKSKGPACVDLVEKRFSVKKQVSELMSNTREKLGI